MNKSIKTMLLGILVVLFGIGLLVAFSGSFPTVNNLVRTLFVADAPEQSIFVYGPLFGVLQNFEGIALVVLCAGFIIGIVGFFYKETQRCPGKDELVEIPLTFRTEEDDETEEVEEISPGKQGRLQMPSRSVSR